MKVFLGNYCFCALGRNVILEGTAGLYLNQVPMPVRDPSLQPSFINTSPTGLYLEERGINITWELIFEQPRDIFEVYLTTCRKLLCLKLTGKYLILVLILYYIFTIINFKF